MSSIHHEDEALLRRLGTIAATVDPVPDTVHDLGRLAFETRLLDAQLARLVEDGAEALAGVRSLATDTRMLAFACDGVDIDVEMVATARGFTLIGQFLPAPHQPGAQARLQTATGERYRATVDSDGFFEFTDVRAGLFRLWFIGTGRGPVVTSWLGP